ncbi:MAG: hypothetical protein HY321_09855 [Armatimonadetes bacterium]|nr:hypothetical protein [Armatimonadota bacterium]
MARFMRIVGVAGVLLTSIAAAHAVQFSVPRVLLPADIGLQLGPAANRKLTVGLQAASWDIPGVDFGQGRTVQFQTQIRPLATVEYQINPRWAIGGWYNAFATDVEYQVNGTPLATDQADGYMMEAHGTYTLGDGFALQLGWQSQRVEWTLTSSASGSTSAQESRLSGATCWLFKHFGLGSVAKKRMDLLLGLGGSNNESGPLGAHQFAGVSCSLSPAVTADASLWLWNIGSRDTFAARATAGFSGRF